MRGAWGKPYGTVARVNIGQILLSIRTKESNAAVVMEALRRARYKFPGRQKIIVSKKWGFTNVNKEEYQRLKAEKRVLQCVPMTMIIRRCADVILGTVPMFSTFAPRATSSRTCATSSVLERCRYYFVLLSVYNSLSTAGAPE
jgi:Ribosomal protein L16/L10E